jgi:hypothetical protein
LKSTLPRQIHDRRRRLFIVLRQGIRVGRALVPLQDSDPSRRNTSLRPIKSEFPQCRSKSTRISLSLCDWSDYARTCDKGGVARRWWGELDRGHHSRRPRKRSCDSMMCSSSRARSNPARPPLGLLVWLLSIRRCAAATRSRARSKSATAYCRGSGRVRFPRRPFDRLLARMAALSCFAAAIWPLRFSKRTASIKTYSARRRERSRGNLGVHGV